MSINQLNSLVENLNQFGTPGHERLVVKTIDNCSILVTEGKRNFLIRLIECLYKPENKRIANVSNFALKIITDNKTYFENNPTKTALFNSVINKNLLLRDEWKVLKIQIESCYLSIKEQTILDSQIKKKEQKIHQTEEKEDIQKKIHPLIPLFDLQKVLDEVSLPPIPWSPLRRKNLEKPPQDLTFALAVQLKEQPRQGLFSSVEICEAQEENEDSTLLPISLSPQDLNFALAAQSKKQLRQELFSSVEICEAQEVCEAQEESKDSALLPIILSSGPQLLTCAPPPLIIGNPPPPPLFGIKKTNQLFENEPKIGSIPIRKEIEKMTNLDQIQEKIVMLEEQLNQLQQALVPIKQALDQQEILNITKQENEIELASKQNQLKQNEQKLIQLESQNSVTVLKLSTGLNKSQDICFIERQRFSEINISLEKLNVALPFKLLKSEEIKFLKERIKILQVEKAEIEQKLKLNNQELVAINCLKNNQILFKDFKILFDKKKTVEQSLTRAIGILKSQLKTLSTTLVSSDITKEKKNLAKADLAHVLKMNPNLITSFPELKIICNLYNDQNASIKLRGEEFHEYLSVN
jgi:hypothetical protein